MLTGENGILTQAQKAKNETENAARQEEMDLAEIEAAITGKDVPIIQVDDKNPGQLEQENDTTFVINSIEDLVFFSHDVTNGTTYEGKTVKLGTNLDFNSDKSYVDPNRTDFAQYGYNGPLKQALTSGTGFSPIGDIYGTQYEKNTFYGTFDGNNNAICSLYININSNQETVRVGLFSGNYGEIRNLGLVDININVEGETTNVGGLTARSYNNIYNCYVTGNISANGELWIPVGGVCGTFLGNNATIENCYNFANIECKNTYTGQEYIADIGCGGIAAQLECDNATINKCFNKGNITADGGTNLIAIGGICGSSSNSTNSQIKNCYNNAKLEKVGEVAQHDCYIGGIVATSSLTNIENCYNSGEIIGSDERLRIGGILAIVRQYKDLTIRNAFNIGEIDTESVNSLGGILAVISGETNVDISNAYNIGIINIEQPNTNQIGSLVGTNWSNLITFNNCFYLKETHDVGVGGNGASTGVTELDSIDKFPSVLEVMNSGEDKVFKEDVKNINNGYPILEWQ